MCEFIQSIIILWLFMFGSLSGIILEVLEENADMSLFSLVAIKIIQICVSWKLAKNKLEIKYLDKLVHLDIFGGRIFGCSIQSSIQISVFLLNDLASQSLISSIHQNPWHIKSYFLKNPVIFSISFPSKPRNIVNNLL